MTDSYQSDSNLALSIHHLLNGIGQRLSLHKKTYGALTGGIMIAAGVPFYTFAFAGHSSNSDLNTHAHSTNASSSSKPSSSSQSRSTSQVSINGEDVTVPENGKIHKETSDEHGYTVVDINVQNSSSADSITTSNSIEVHSSTNSNSGGP